MNNLTKAAIMCRAVEHFGKDHQIHKCIEEMAELTKELIKDLNGEGNREHIVEEYSDLMITLYEINGIYGITLDEEEAWTEKKLKRLRDRMETEETIEHADNSASIEMDYEK